MKKNLAIPTENGRLCTHFGHCEKFSLFSIEDGKIISEEQLSPPPHKSGAYPNFLAKNGVNIIIAGGMGHKARQIFEQNNIEVVMGIDTETPSSLAEKYVNDQLQSGTNLCDH